MTEDELIEALADKEHSSWARWMCYVFDIGKTNEDGSFTIPAESVTRWLRQVNTDYKELSEREKQSDRDEVAHILPIIKDFRDTLLGEMFEAWKRKNPILAESFCPTEEQDSLLDVYKLRGDLIEPPTARPTTVRWLDCNEVEHAVLTIDDDEITVRCLVLLVKQVRGEVQWIRVEH